MKRIVLIVMLLISVFAECQQQHLEIGAKLGFKDEFHVKPEFNSSSKYTEIHSFDAYFFGRVSKRRFGTEFGLGFEKASDFFVRYSTDSIQLGFLNLNRFQFDFSEYFYLHKSAKQKWDFQVGLRNYFGFNKNIWIPQKMELKTWKLSGRIATNYTYKTFMVGLFYEYNFRSDYVESQRPIVFGLTIGVVF